MLVLGPRVLINNFQNVKIAVEVLTDGGGRGNIPQNEEFFFNIKLIHHYYHSR